MSNEHPKPVYLPPSLTVTPYDRVAGMIVAALVLVGGFVGVLFLMFLFTADNHPRLYPISESVEGNQSGNQVSGPLTELESPTADEMPQLAEVSTSPSLTTLIESASSVAATADLLSLASSTASTNSSSSTRRPVGPLRNGPNVVPRWDRWEIRYQANTLENYVSLLDFFQIELGAIGRKPNIDYARRFAGGTPLIHQGKGTDEKRLYMNWTSGTLQEFDRRLLERAGIEMAGRQVVQFYPQALEDLLARIEFQHSQSLAHSQVDQILKTVFGVVPAADGFEFQVIEQRFRSTH